MLNSILVMNFVINAELVPGGRRESLRLTDKRGGGGGHMRRLLGLSSSNVLISH